MSAFCKKFLGIGLLVLFALSATAFIASAQSGQTADVSDVAKHPDQYAGKQVTLNWKVDHVYSPTVIGLEKNEEHLLVIAPDGFPGKMKKGDAFKGTGVVRNFDKAALAREYKNVNLGKAPLHKIKDVLILGTVKSAQLEKPQPTVIEPEIQPVAPEEQAAAPAPAPALAPEPAPAPTPAPVEEAQNDNTPKTLPRTASPIPAIGLLGLLLLMAGVGVRALRRQNG